MFDLAALVGVCTLPCQRGMLVVNHGQRRRHRRRGRTNRGQGMTERIERMKGGAWNAEAVNQVAGISYTYRSPEVDASVRLTVGDRAPDGSYGGDRRIYDLFEPRTHTLLLFGGPEHRERLTALANAAAGRYRARFVACVIASSSDAAEDNEDLVRDHDGALAERYGAAGGEARACVVRPDLHIAYLGEPDGVWAALDDTLIRA